MALTRIKTDQITDGEVKSADIDTNITLSGDLSVTDITMTGELNGPATFYIDPAPHDPDTDGATNGLVVIRGDLQVDGTTTTINSTTMDVADLNITLASGAANAAAADGAGLTVDGASATLLYDNTNDLWKFNKGVRSDVGLTVANAAPSFVLMNATGTYNHKFRLNGSNSLIVERYNGTSTLSTLKLDETGDVGFYENNGGTPQVGMHWDYADGSLGIGTTSPGNLLHVKSDVNNGAVITVESTAADSYPFVRLKNDVQEYQITAHGPLGDKFTIYDGTAGSHRFTINTSGKVGINTTSPDALLHVSDTSPHIDIGPQGGNRGKIGYHDLDVYIGSTSSTGEIIFKNNIGSTDSPQDSGDIKMVIGDTNVGIGVQTPTSKLTVGANSITTLKPTAIFVDGNNGGSVTIRGLSPTLAFDKTGTNASARILLDGGALQFRDNDLDATNPNQTNAPYSNLLMVLSHDGKLGIGNFGDNGSAPYYIDPSYQLHVKGAGDIKIEDDTGGSAHLRIGASTSGTRDSEWKVKVSGSLDEFHIDHDYTAGGAAGAGNVFKITGDTHSIYSTNSQPTTKPALSFDFAATKKLDPRLAFHRNSHATYYDSKGILRYSGQNQPRFDHDPATGESKGLLIEPQRTNLNTYTNDMYNDWSQAAVTVHQNMGIAPDETHTADLVIANQNSSARHFLYKGQSIINAGVTYTFSVYIKPYNSPSQSFRMGYRVDSDTQPGDQYVTPTVIEDNLPNGWQRVAFTITVGANPSIGLGQLIIGPTNGYTPSKLEGYYVWGYQIEISDSATSHIPSIQAWNQRSSRGTFYDQDGILCNAGEDDPRISYHYNGRKFVEMDYLREPASENVWTNAGLESSRGLIAATGSTTRTYFYDTAPDGSQEAVRIQWANGYAYRVLSNTLGDSDPWAISFYIKPYSGTARFGFGGTFGSQYWTFNFDTLAVANSAAHANTTLQYGFIRDVGNGWYRVEITFLSTGASGYTEIQWSGTGSADYAIWGIQFEQSKYSATSFIYSGDSTTTRSADLLLASTSNNRADDNVELNFEEYASDKFTFYGEAEARQNDPGRLIALAPSETDTSNIISLNLESTYFRFYQYTDGAVQFNGTSQNYTLNTPLKFAGSWAENDVAYVVDGGTPYTATTAPLYTWKHLRIGSMNPGQYFFQGTIKKIAYYDEQLSDAQITALTEND